MSIEPLNLLLGRESGGCLIWRRDVRARQMQDVKHCLKVAYEQLHYQGLVGVVHQGGEGHLSVRPSWFDQRGTKDNPQVACSHLVLLCLLRHSEGRPLKTLLVETATL